MKHFLFVVSSVVILISSSTSLFGQPSPADNLHFDSLANKWDEGIPLGNGWLGALIWRKGDKIRMSLDRVDLWDDRPMPEIDQLRFDWVVAQVKKGQYDTVQKIGDEPYERYAAPSKIPGAALEFDLSKIGHVVSNDLDIATGLSVIHFDNGVVFNNYIHADQQTGYFGFEGLTAAAALPELLIPKYHSDPQDKKGRRGGNGLERLGYAEGTRTTGPHSIRYHQPTWNGSYYEVLVDWYVRPGGKLIGQWTITKNKPASLPTLDFSKKEPTGWPSHIKWWNDYWSRSSVTLPDKLLERQYYLEMYKFACVARSNTPPISLQAVWTADNGGLPPWKGDYHHDLNTQLSYWPGFSGNHLELTSSFTNWLWQVKDENKRWTKEYFGLPGLNVPGVTTISGKPMGGWIQYSLSPSTAAWLAQFFYWQASYSGDKKFARDKALPYLEDVYTFMNAYIEKGKKDTAFRAMGSSPEYNDNSIKAWYRNLSNYDRGSILSLKPEILKMKKLLDEKSTPTFVAGEGIDGLELVVNQTGLPIAAEQDMRGSHRHLSNYLAIYPMGLLNIEDSAQKSIIDRSISWMESKGTRGWMGYTFGWAACIYARAQRGDSAVRNLQKFASNFCSSNSFHLNGDQHGGQYASATYRPFTLEGNFAFAQGVHELLLQSHKGYIEIFPAVPSAWKDVSFRTLRAEGAFLVSAIRENGTVSVVKIRSEQGGPLRIKLPFRTFVLDNRQKKYTLENNILSIDMKKGETLQINNGYE